MEWTTLDFWIISAGILASLSCALLGNFLILKRMSMMGDAISHSVLPGLAIAFFKAGLVISLKAIRLVLFISSFNSSAKCQEIASPSRSSSVASQTSSTFLTQSFNSLTTFRFAGETW